MITLILCYIKALSFDKINYFVGKKIKMIATKLNAVNQIKILIWYDSYDFIWIDIFLYNNPTKLRQFQVY